MNKKNLEDYIAKWEFHCLKLRTMLKRGLKSKQPLLWRMREKELREPTEKNISQYFVMQCEIGSNGCDDSFDLKEC